MPAYRPSFLFRSAHINTVYPSLFRKQISPAFDRVQVATEDDDFVDVDFLRAGNSKVAILCHGLEGSSESQYIIGTSRILFKSGWDIAAMNYRGCSGRPNKQLRMYHSGATDDLHQVYEAVTADYEEIALIGFSLGGNLVLKYLGESERDKKINKAVAISVPLDLRAGSINIGKKSNYFYERNFLQSLSQKIRQKQIQFPQDIDLSLLSKVKTLYDFDDVFTGPIHGFRDADDYYQQCSSKFFLENIRTESLVLNSLDDPFLPAECYLSKQTSTNKNITTVTTKHGGHVGFVVSGNDHSWAEMQISEFLNK